MSNDHTGHDVRKHEQVRMFGEDVDLGNGAYHFCHDCDCMVP